MNIEHLIISLGGRQEIARKLGITDVAVSLWVRRGAIPTKHYLSIIKMAAAQKIKITMDDLDSMRRVGQ